MLAHINWTVVVGSLTAIFTGAVALFAVLGYKLGLNEARTSKRTLYKLAVVDLLQHWVKVTGHTDQMGVQMRLLFENKHPADPIRYEIESSSIAVVDTFTALPSTEPIDAGTGSGVIPPGLREAFTLAPVPPEGEEPFSMAAPPKWLWVEFVVRYGAVRHHKEFEFEWRESRAFVASLPQVPDLSGMTYSIPWTWQGSSELERLSGRSRWERIRRKR
jgi:hypothetical protein